MSSLLTILLLTAIGEKLIGTHGGLQVDKQKSFLSNSGVTLVVRGLEQVLLFIRDSLHQARFETGLSDLD